MANDKKWLKHLENAVPMEAYGYKLCMYTIALEGWRRGLKLKFFNLHFDNKLRVRFSLSNGENEYKFAVSRGSLVTKEAINICVNKDKTKEFLEKAGVSVPKGKSFSEDVTDEDIIEYASTLGFPVVLKPISGGMGKGVIPNIQSEDELKEALIYVRQTLNSPNVIIEKYIKGKDYRLFVIGDKVAGAITRIPANVIGDGKSTIRELIKQKNIERRKNPYLYGRLIKIDKELRQIIKSKGYSLKSVLNNGEQVFLREKSNVSAGGEPIEITNKLTPEIKSMAIQAVKAIPGLLQGAVDMVVDEEQNTGVVLEINSKAQISGHLFPEIGEAQDVPSAIIDYYFPETIGKTRMDHLYYDFKSMLQPLSSGLVKEVIVPPAPKYKHKVKAYVVSGKVQKVGYRKWIRRYALRMKLNGFVKNLEDGNVLIVISGAKKNMEEFQELIHSKSPRRAKVKSIREKTWDKPIKIGFEVVEDENYKNDENRIYEEKMQKLKNENLKLKKEITKLRNSRSWKYTEPLRKVGAFIKRAK